MPTFRLIDLVRDRELLDAGAARGGALVRGVGARRRPRIDQLLQSWEQRFKLIEVG